MAESDSESDEDEDVDVEEEIDEEIKSEEEASDQLGRRIVDEQFDNLDKQGQYPYFYCWDKSAKPIISSNKKSSTP